MFLLLIWVCSDDFPCHRYKDISNRIVGTIIFFILCFRIHSFKLDRILRSFNLHCWIHRRFFVEFLHVLLSLFICRAANWKFVKINLLHKSKEHNFLLGLRRRLTSSIVSFLNLIHLSSRPVFWMHVSSKQISLLQPLPDFPRIGSFWISDRSAGWL